VLSKRTTARCGNLKLSANVVKLSKNHYKCTSKGLVSVSSLLPAALRDAQACRYLVYSEADFEVFRPAGATRCTDGGEIWHGGGPGPLLHAKFHPIGATTRV